MAKYSMNIDKIIVDNKAKLKLGINRALNKLKSTVKDLSPVDTGEFIHNHQTIGAEDIGGNKISGSIRNDTPYAHYIEYGRIFQGKENNYYKFKKKGTKPIYTGIGNRTYQRAGEKEKKNIKEIIINSLRGQ